MTPSKNHEAKNREAKNHEAKNHEAKIGRTNVAIGFLDKILKNSACNLLPNTNALL